MPNTQYKTVGVQWFAVLWFSRQPFPRWTRTQPENPTVSYCHPLAFSVKRQPPHIQAHLVLPDTQSRPFAKPKELEFFPPQGRQL